MFLSSSLFPFEEFPIVLCTVICILFLGSAGKTVSTPPRLVSQNTSISRHTDSCQQWAGVPRQSKQNFPLGFWKSSWEIHASGFMSCDKDVSQLVYLLPLQKSVPGNKSNKEKKKQSWDWKEKERERECRRKVVDNNETERKVLVTVFEAPSSSQTWKHPLRTFSVISAINSFFLFVTLIFMLWAANFFSKIAR